VTDTALMEADCVHGVKWYECKECPQGPEPCPGRIVIHDDRWGSMTSLCSLYKYHLGDHAIPYDACDPPARLVWPNPDAPQPPA
jgi:hypothetical protein